MANRKEAILKRLSGQIADYCSDRSISDVDMLEILDELSSDIEGRAECIRDDLARKDT